MKTTRLLLLVLLALLLPQASMADAISDGNEYRVYLLGLEQMRFEMPVYDEENFDGWIKDGKIQITPEGGGERTVFQFHTVEKTGAEPKVWFKKGVNGKMILSRSGKDDLEVTTTENTCRVGSSTNIFRLAVTWTVPEEYRGKDVVISWEISKDAKGNESSGSVNIAPSSWSIPSMPELVKPQVMKDAILGFDNEHVGQTMLLYTMTNGDITSLTAHYTEVNGGIETKKSVWLEPEMSGFIYLDADKCYKDLTLEARYTDMENKSRISFSDSTIVPVLHTPCNLAATLRDDGLVTLTWRCRNNGWNDILPDDTWEVQRNTSGVLNSEALWVTFAQVDFENADAIYTCTDASLVENYQGKPVYYRVRRTSTGMWDWKEGTYAMTSLPYSLRLPAIKNATATRSRWVEDDHVVNISYEMGSKSQYDKDGRFILRTVEDWKTLAALVESGKRDVNVVMAADIDLGDDQTMIGTSNNPWTGEFDGGAHTLTVHYKRYTSDTAPFSYVGDAHIKNLHVAGSIYSTNKRVGGIIAYTLYSEVTIEKCRVSAAITSTWESESAYLGGFVGSSVSSITITNSLFDGQLITPNADETTENINGFIGYCSQDKVSVTNCLFAPTRVDVPNGNDIHNFTSSYGTSLCKNNYVLTNLGNRKEETIDGKTFHILRNNNDWLAFLNMIEQADGSYDVNAIMDRDFDITEPAGLRSNIPFRGIFDGNGHTLGVKINRKGQDNIAPFSHARDATIRNLNIRGYVIGNQHPAGLVGASEGNTVTVLNCHVSADIYCNNSHAGGIIGHGYKVRNTIRNCLFDGTITATQFWTWSFAGAFLGWEDGGTTNDVTGNLENGFYSNFDQMGLNFNALGSGYEWGGTNNWSTHQWKEANFVDAMSSQDLKNRLGAANWQGFGNLVVPKQTQRNFITQGTLASDMEPSELLSLLNATHPNPSRREGLAEGNATHPNPSRREGLAEGNIEVGESQWMLYGDIPVPVMKASESSEHATLQSDRSAKIVLITDKSVGGDVHSSERHDLTDDEKNARLISHELLTSCVDHDFRLVVEQAGSKLMPLDSIGTTVTKTETDETERRYEFDNNVQIDSLQATTNQSTVTLTWWASGQGDYYRISRRDKATDEEEVLEESYNLNVYIDKTPRPQHVYVYTVEGVNECEGRHVSIESIEGFCKPTGMVRGYVRLPDGTAMSGVTVTATPYDSENGRKGTDVTDETGFFEIGDLPYLKAGSYIITVAQAGNQGSFTDFTANFDEDINLVNNAVLIQKSYHLFEGYVMYEGTSVPVVGAQFERDGMVVNNGSGKPITTDSQGRFSISIPQGDHTIRVMKDGHVFADEGYFLDEDGNKDVSWQKGIFEYVFWDKTTITMRGRVVGGDVQGSKPLGELASVNNLGDSLTIVMQLEGDNASYLVRDQLNASITERHQDFHFGLNRLDSCHMDTYRHRLVIKPSPVTGEYCVPMLPVKYKVTEIYAEGYPTLFQAGMVGETLDLSDYINKDTVTYSRIYHSMPTVAVSQFNMTGEEFMGIKAYTYLDNTGKEASIELWNKDSGYSFGHPVFMAGSSIIMSLAAVEQYYKNNNLEKGVPDIVHLSGGKVHIQNSLIDTDESQTVELDDEGEGFYRFVPQNLTFTEENDLALKTLTMTLEYDGTFYDVLPMAGEPIRGYVMAAKAVGQGNRVVSECNPVLIDILRDPPGSESSAYIESGTKLNYTFTQDVKAKAGFDLKIGMTKGGMSMWKGVWAGEGSGQTLGNNTSVKTTNLVNFSFVSIYYNRWQYGYTFETKERISTSSSVNHVGRDADVFIGMVRNAVVEDGIAVRAVDEDTYKLMTTQAGGTFTIDGSDFKVPQGTMKLLAQGKDSKGNPVYLIRDEVMKVRSELKSTFAHSQKYIEKELIPELILQRNTLILPMGTSDVTALEVAKQKGCPVYVSLVPQDNEYFGVEDHYKQIDPDDGFYGDSIAAINDRIRAWIVMLGTNEKDKLLATDLVKTYEVDGRASVTYTESFGASADESRYWQVPFINSALQSFSFGSLGVGPGPNIGNPQERAEGEGGKSKEITIEQSGAGMTMSITPVVSLDYNYNFGESSTTSKSISFTLKPKGGSNLLVDVYRTRMDKEDLDARVDSLLETGLAKNREEAQEYFFQYVSDYNYRYLRRGGENWEDFGPQGTLNGLCSYIGDSPAQYRSFVYRTRGGATCQPYEDERRTKYFAPGTILDAKTLEIDRPRIWVDQASVSNVPYDEPARFVIHVANESETPAQATQTLPFRLFLDPSSNPNGAKIYVDGHPLIDDLDIYLTPDVVSTKVVEVYPGAGYDYDNLSLCVKAPNDISRTWSCDLSAHFVPMAGKVEISLPGDKWVVNTESQFDAARQQYYMPVRIDGFDVNYPNFDHIELQYKLSTQGDKEWVNVCSYYDSDSLMAKATGERKLITDDGHIMATFWGEADPIEQQYDLRAVNYCRYGSGFLTRSSNILTGIKDTRRPQLFGTPKPEDGILDIGEDILLRFSEPIAGNYLRGLNNFQVLGQTNSSNIALSTDLRFNGTTAAASLSPRNLSCKSFTIDMMVKPDQGGNRMMVLFSHGNSSNRLEVGVSDDNKLMAAINNHSVFSNKVIDFKSLHQLVFVFEADLENQKTYIRMYDGSQEVCSDTYNGLYYGDGDYVLGADRPGGLDMVYNYEGEMLEFRLWNRALTPAEISEYGQKRLTGYELGLLDNFPLNEGQGLYSYNRVSSGGDLYLGGSAWNVPDGIGMRLDGQEGFRIDPQKFSRTSYQDYTMTFWFRTDDEEGTLLANGKAETEPDATNHFNFGVHQGMFDLHIGGRDILTTTKVNDGNWHHVALSVNRSRNVGNLYVDQSLKKTFAVDTLGGIAGNRLAAGVTMIDSRTVERPVTGYIDEIAMYEMALPENMIKATASMTLTGEELGLLAYLSFSRNELQMNNLQELVPTGISLKRYRDMTTGELTTQRDTLVAQDVIERLADKNQYAPMRGMVALENIPYSFVSKDNELYINLDMPDYKIEKTNVLVTVKDVTDLNGNAMSSPVTMDFYVYRNPLRWKSKQLSFETHYGDESTFEAVVENKSGKTKRFTLEGLPVWITASQYSGVVGPLSEQTITFTISPYTNIGDYDEVISLSGEDAMSEPLPLFIKVRGMSPDWAVDDELLKGNLTMSIIGQVSISDEVAHDRGDMLAAFDGEHRLLGVAHLDNDPMGIGNDWLAYLNIYNPSLAPTPLFFEFYDASTGTIHKVQPVGGDGQLTFKKDTVLGSTTEPQMFGAAGDVVQVIPLKRGWNWVSFNVTPEADKIQNLMGKATRWEVGDGLETTASDGSPILINYKSVVDSTGIIHQWDYADRVVSIDPRMMYRFFSNSDKQAYIAGSMNDVKITVRKGWNRIGYVSTLNLPLSTAMSIYAENGSNGDIIKSQDEFAVLSIDAQGNKQWKGTLRFLRVGEGYMLKRQADSEISFYYPEYLPGSIYGGSSSRKLAFENTSGTSMTIVAMADGVEVQPGDRLTAYRGADVCGIAEADGQGVFYLSVGDTADTGDSRLSFTLERDDDVIATTNSKIGFHADAAMGTPSQPTAISFTNAVGEGANGWYTLSGIKLNKRPSLPGVYIHNSEKVVIK